MIGAGSRNRKWRDEIRQLEVELRKGSSIASNNIAATYRQLGEFRHAFQWWMRTARAHGGDAWLEVGYCLQYGIGTRRDHGAAIGAYRRALKGTMSEFSEEETQYLLAVALLDRGSLRDVAEARTLLTLAAEDGDFPSAADLLRQLVDRSTLSICRCCRELPRRFGGKTHCPLHNGRAGVKRH